MVVYQDGAIIKDRV
jgi:V-type H+-transporting ATPase subunit a